MHKESSCMRAGAQVASRESHMGHSKMEVRALAAGAGTWMGTKVLLWSCGS
jgi:hypothetical protein